MMGEKEKYFLPSGETIVEVSEEVYRSFYQMARRERYLLERDKANHVYSYNNLDGVIENGENVLKCNIHGFTGEEQLKKTQLRLLYRCLESLTQSERALINAIYFEQLSEQEYGRSIGMSQPGVGKRRKKILSKMKTIMEYLESSDDSVIS